MIKNAFDYQKFQRWNLFLAIAKRSGYVFNDYTALTPAIKQNWRRMFAEHNHTNIFMTLLVQFTRSNDKLNQQN